ncbi:MAG TPA: TIGR03118 family protein [Candidatus Angelobacter sp.]
MKIVERKAPAAVLMLAVAISALLSSNAWAQYTRTDLVSNQAGVASFTDPDLINGWGLTRSSGSPFWVSDNVTGKSTLYNGAGVKRSLVVTIPPASGNGAGTPTGTVFNITIGSATPAFAVSKNGATAPAFFLFDTLDGTISGWNPTVDPTNAVIAAVTSGATYTGLAIASTESGDFLYAADNGPRSRVDIFDSNFKLVNSFTDPAITGGFAPYGIQNIHGNIWVTFGGNKSSTGFVDKFDTAGNLLMRIPSNAPFHSPWGLAMAPANFGSFSGALLVANNIPKGRIVALDPTTGAFLGVLRDTSGQAIEIDQIWAIQFGNGGQAGLPNQLFFTAGPNNYANGLFGMITAQ